MNPEDLSLAIEREITRRVEIAIGAEIEEAKRRIETRIRGDVAAIAAQVLTNFSIERMSRDLVIRVNFEGAK